LTYKAEFSSNPNISTKGFGKPGFCSICAIRPDDKKFQKALTSLYREQQSASKINDFLVTNIGKPSDRRVIYRHREHITHPRDRLVGSIASRQVQDGLPADTTEEQLQQAIINAAYARVVAEPDAVTIDQGLKAAGLKQQAKQSRQAGINMLVQIFAQPLAGVPELLRLGDGIEEGEYVED